MSSDALHSPPEEELQFLHRHLSVFEQPQRTHQPVYLSFTDKLAGNEIDPRRPTGNSNTNPGQPIHLVLRWFWLRFLFLILRHVDIDMSVFLVAGDRLFRHRRAERNYNKLQLHVLLGNLCRSTTNDNVASHINRPKWFRNSSDTERLLRHIRK